MNPHTRMLSENQTVTFREAYKTIVRDIRTTMMIPSVLTQLAKEEETLLTPIATLVLRIVKTGMETEAPN